MPRRQFVADLQKASQDDPATGVNDVRKTEDDGQFEFLFATSSIGVPASTPFKVTAMVTDLDAYPRSHEWMIFVSDETPPAFSTALERLKNTNGKSVLELLAMISAALVKVQPDVDGDVQMPDSQYDISSGAEDDDSIYGDDDAAFASSAPTHSRPSMQSAPDSATVATSAFRSRIRADLRATKQAGFKVGFLGHFLDGHNAFVTVSIRIAKLGISDEAMQAWQVEPTDYLILIIQYPNGYKTVEQFKGYDAIRLRPNINIRICAGKRYKPTLQQAIKVFSKAQKTERARTGSVDAAVEVEEYDFNAIRDTFISKPMVSLLEERLIPILRYRDLGMPWKGAEDCYVDAQGARPDSVTTIPDRHYVPEKMSKGFPRIVQRDHYGEKGVTQHSFPLLAMQFLLRHFVRCTEFCLVCHSQLDSEIEAIKPYICGKDLCLFQYMAMGFGPSIEHEIMAQPYVVDLLLSFCYNAACIRKLKDFPNGLALMVPPAQSIPVSLPYSHGNGYGNPASDSNTKEKSTDQVEAVEYEVGFDAHKNEIIFFTPPQKCPVRAGDWIVLKTSSLIGSTDVDLHCRIADVTFYPTISINNPLRAPAVQLDHILTHGGALQIPKAPVTPASTPKFASATFQIYDQDFDQFNDASKCSTICRLLDTLPDVKAMQEYLMKERPADLKRWIDRIAPATLSLLRWIIASNRACIMQVDHERELAADGSLVNGNKEERLCGMKDWIQFRFAMGAPDKEQRFAKSVRETMQRLSLQFPTLFAWHGSPLHNWHSIIREGLHFKDRAHGRAYGDGVYHAKDARTSTAYTGGRGPAGSIVPQGTWPNSVLRISQAMALNEIVNAPDEFVSSHPYYVVAQLDWIQTRYLFIQCAPVSEQMKAGEEVKPKREYPQHAERTPIGVNGPVSIPAGAIKTNKAFTALTEKNSPRAAKKLKGLGGFFNPIVADEQEETGWDAIDDGVSVATDAEDWEILLDEQPINAPCSQGKEMQKRENAAFAKSKRKPGRNDFEPGTLDYSKLPLMPEPTYANAGASKRLLREFQALVKIQESTPLNEVGWYIDPEKFDNVYQWIVELHSFDIFEVKGKKIPLADDMAKKKVKSIVLEMRFGGDFPFSPPYIRVIKPRFLSLAQGGGGHIVMGGAMCMELLTNTGWSSVSSMESVLMQVRMAIASEPYARLDPASGDMSYGTAEAASGYIRACRAHGWEVPPGFETVASGG